MAPRQPPPLVTDADVDLAGIVLADSITGETVDLGAETGPTILTLIRHRYWLPCQQHLVEVRCQRTVLDAMGGRAVAVGFSPPDALAALARYLEWPWPFLSDPEQQTYRRLDVPRARLRDVYTVKTLRIYATALLHGQRIRQPVEDTRQLGADAIVRNGRAIQVFRSLSPDDRPPVTDLVAAVGRHGHG